MKEKVLQNLRDWEKKEPQERKKSHDRENKAGYRRGIYAFMFTAVYLQ